MSARREPSTRMSILVEYVRVMADTGVDPDEMIQRAGISLRKAQKPTERLPLRQLAQLINITSQRLGDPLFGAQMGIQVRPLHLGALGSLITLAPTLGSAIAGAGRYLRVFNDGPSASLCIDQSTAVFAYKLPVLPDVDQRQHAEYVIAACLRMIRGVIGENWTPDEVVLGHELRVRRADYEARYKAPVVSRPTGGAPRLRFPAATLNTPNRLADPSGHAALERHLAEQLRLGHSSEDLLALLRHEISRRLLGGESQVSVAAIAKALGYSVRTLQRRLQERQTSFDELVDETREHWARHYLEDERMTISDAAYLLGYGELSSFTRAFHRWAGESPRDYRRRLRKAIA